MRIWLPLVATIVATIFTACNSEEPPKEEHLSVTINQAYPIIVTEMEPSSIIALPDGISFDGNISNSLERMFDILPSDVIKEFPEYSNIDFKNHSLISLKYRMFYKIENIEYSIFKTDNNIVVNQLLYVSGDLSLVGYFVMSNLMTDKIPDNATINLQQSYVFGK